MRLKHYINEATEQIDRWDDYTRRNPMLFSAISVLEKITSKGYEAYLVGGCVRDIIIGVEPHDIDIATNMSVDKIEQLYHTHDIGKSKDFGIVVVQEGSFQYEVANFRSDGTYTDGRRPESIQVEMSFEADASRRDFTINAMAIDKDGNIIDYFDGKKDIKNKVLRTVGDPEKRFSEDYLRMMRLARFSAKLGFGIDPKTKEAATKLSANITKLAPERIRDEILKAAEQSGDKFADYILDLDDMGILGIILPEVTKQKGFEHAVIHHPEGGVWEHMIAAMRVNKIKDPLINLAIMLHDIGKPDTATQREHGGTAYFGHAEKGIELVDNIATRLKLSNKEKEKLLFAVGNHMKFHLLLGMKPSKVFKLVNDDNWDILVAVAMADNYSRGKGFKYELDFEDIVKRAVDIKDKWGKKAVNPIQKLVDGNTVMKLTGLKPSKRVGEIIKQTTDFIIDNDVNPNDTETINDYIKKIAGEK